MLDVIFSDILVMLRVCRWNLLLVHYFELILCLQDSRSPLGSENAFSVPSTSTAPASSCLDDDEIRKMTEHFVKMDSNLNKSRRMAFTDSRLLDIFSGICKMVREHFHSSVINPSHSHSRNINCNRLTSAPTVAIRSRSMWWCSTTQTRCPDFTTFRMRVRTSCSVSPVESTSWSAVPITRVA